jgi:hypothetical protein
LIDIKRLVERQISLRDLLRELIKEDLFGGCALRVTGNDQSRCVKRGIKVNANVSFCIRFNV